MSEATATFTGRASSAEREMRVAICDHLRQILPEARVIHELMCGGNRADLAAIEPERLTLIEIKSERDTLDRCEDQMAAFTCYGHAAILAAHEKFFDRTPYDNGAERLVWGRESYGHAVWCYPEPEQKHIPFCLYHWKVPDRSIRQPAPRRLLEILWRAELREECKRHNIVASARATCPWMVDQMAYHMSGREIARAVCRQLRKRQVLTGDAPVPA